MLEKHKSDRTMLGGYSVSLISCGYDNMRREKK
jgi:hypothetical protein